MSNDARTAGKETLLEVRFPSRRHLLSSSRVDGANLSLFVPTTHFPPTNTTVRLKVTVGDGELRFDLVGKVRFHRPLTLGAEGAAGIALSFDGEQKREAARMLAVCAGKSVELGSASSPRYGKLIDCTLRVGNRKVAAQVRDLSVGGAFVVSSQISRIRVGAEVILELSRGFLGLGAKRLQARVVWCGEKKGSMGFGARFLGGAEAIRPTLRGYLPESIVRETA